MARQSVKFNAPANATQATALAEQSVASGQAWRRAVFADRIIGSRALVCLAVGGILIGLEKAHVDAPLSIGISCPGIGRPRLRLSSPRLSVTLGLLTHVRFVLTIGCHLHLPTHPSNRDAAAIAWRGRPRAPRSGRAVASRPESCGSG